MKNPTIIIYMALAQTDQIFELFKRSDSPLICVPEGAGPDGYASALGMSSALKKINKQPTIVTAEKSVPKNIQFLSGHEEIKTQIDHLRKFVVEVDAKQTKVKELSYEMKGDKLRIYLSPRKGIWSEKDVNFLKGNYGHDLIIIIGASDLESLGEMFHEESDFFFETPIINIDHLPENEMYGQINAVDLTASACSEVCHQIIDDIERSLIDEDMATAFLTGMIAKTKSFKNPNIRPKTLERAGLLMNQGANRDLIVERLYRTRSVGTLRLWGRVLARLKADENIGIVWSLLSNQDFIHAGAGEDELPDVMDELIASCPHSKVIVLMYQNSGGEICSIVKAQGGINALQITSGLDAVGNHVVARLCYKNRSLPETEKLVIDRIKKELKNK